MEALREFNSSDEMLAFYRDLRARIRAWGSPSSPEAPKPAPPPPPQTRPLFPMTPLERIVHAVAKEFHLPRHVIRSAARTQDAVVARQVVVLLAKELTNTSNRMIGIALGHRDHSTINHSSAAIAGKIQRDQTLAAKVNRLRIKLLGRSSI